jgi:hypothetical protein
VAEWAGSPALRRGLLLAGLMLLTVLGWRLLALGLADRHAARDHAQALHWRIDHAAANRQAALAALAANQPEAAAAHARAALQRYPLEGRSYRVLAALLEAGDAKTLLYDIAVKRAPRDAASLAWRAGEALAADNVDTAMADVDQLLRVRPDLLRELLPAILEIVERPEGAAALVQPLQRDPPWRGGLLAQLARQWPDASRLLRFVGALQQAGLQLKPRERNEVLERLIRERAYSAAYLFWFDGLPPERSSELGNVYNGGFEWAPDNGGFDWRIGRIAGARVERLATAGMEGSAALRISFQHRRVPFNHLRQLLALPPGNYRFQGRVKLEGLRNERGLLWSISCATDNRVLADSEGFSGSAAWHSFEVDLQVPVEGCDGQWLALRLPARIPAEQLIGGVVWFDALRITRQHAAVVRPEAQRPATATEVDE